MSEVKLNLIDLQGVVSGTIHGFVADSCVAALSAEPETIPELEAALSRYIRPDYQHGPFASFRHGSELDTDPWDAGLVIIDLAARIVSVESTYSQPQPEGSVQFHDGAATDIQVPYCLPPDWLFVNSVESYRWSAFRRREQRAATPPIDTRAVLYGRPLLDFILQSGIERVTRTGSTDDLALQEARVNETSKIHADWLTTTRDDLRGRSPRQVLLEKQAFINVDLDSRCWQWTMQNEGPPCLSRDSFAYRFGGYGTHEWVVYYDLVRYLLCRAAEIGSGSTPDEGAGGKLSVQLLEKLKLEWLENAQPDYDGKIPIIIIENERKRLPEAMTAAEMIVDDDCEICRMSALDVEMGYGPGFWHLDGCNMDDEFAFSTCLTLEEWEAEQREREEFNRNFNRKWRGMAAEESLDDTAVPQFPF